MRLSHSTTLPKATLKPIIPSPPGDSDKEQEILDVTLKGVDSEKGIEGAALDALLFGDSGWTWNEVEKVEFSSEGLFSVSYKAEDGLHTLGEVIATDRATGDSIWNTEWTLDASKMGKEKYAKIIAKDGTVDVTVKVYIKQDAEKPAGADQVPTGIALAVAPIVLASGFVIVASKKRKYFSLYYFFAPRVIGALYCGYIKQNTLVL